MVKRCIVAVSAVLILIPVLCFSVFADSELYLVTFNDTTGYNWWGGDVDIYTSTSGAGCGINNNGGINELSLSARFTSPITLKIENNTDYVASFEVNRIDYGVDFGFSVGDIIFIEPHSSFISTSQSYNPGGNYSRTILGFVNSSLFPPSGSESSGDTGESSSPSTEESVSGYSPFDTTPLFPIISALYTFITGNTVLVVLFFIGVAVSLGFVAIRIIRKTMWSK